MKNMERRMHTACSWNKIEANLAGLSGSHRTVLFNFATEMPHMAVKRPQEVAKRINVMFYL